MVSSCQATGNSLRPRRGPNNDNVGHRTNLGVFKVSDDSSVTQTTDFDDASTIVGIWKMVFAADSQSLIVGSQIDAKSSLRSFAAQTGAVNWGQDGFASYWVRALAVSPDGQLLVSGDENGMLRLSDMQSGAKITERRTGLVIQSLAFSEDGRQLAVALWDSTIGVVDVPRLVE